MVVVLVVVVEECKDVSLLDMGSLLGAGGAHDDVDGASVEDATNLVGTSAKSWSTESCRSCKGSDDIDGWSDVGTTNGTVPLSNVTDRSVVATEGLLVAVPVPVVVDVGIDAIAPAIDPPLRNVGATAEVVVATVVVAAVVGAVVVVVFVGGGDEVDAVALIILAFLRLRADGT